MGDRWYITRGNRQRYGPYTMEQLKEFVRMGRLQPPDMLLLDGSPKWAPAASVEALFPPPLSTPIPTKAPIRGQTSRESALSFNQIAWRNKWVLGGTVTGVVLTVIVSLPIITGVTNKRREDRAATLPTPGVQPFKPDLAKLQGVWEYSQRGRRSALVVEGESVVFLRDEKRMRYKLVLSPHSTPKEFDLLPPETTAREPDEKPLQGLYRFDGDCLKVAADGLQRPTAFTEGDTWLFYWKCKSANFTPTDHAYYRGLKTWDY